VISHRRLSDSSILHLLVGASSLALLSSSAASGQVGINVNSSLDTTASITSRNAAVPPTTTGPTALPEGLSGIRLAPGFTVHLSVYNVPELQQTLEVDEQGALAVPQAGIIPVSGQTLRAAEGAIRQALLDRQILVNPQVTLSVAGYPARLVTVSGEVQQPGRFPMLKPQTVLDLLAQAGGITTAAGGDIEVDHPGADGVPVEIRHIPFANGKPPVEARAALVYPGDSIFVRRAGVVYVLGAVSRPGGYLMVNGEHLTVPRALALASGTTIVASVDKAIVVRMSDGQPQQIVVAMQKEEQGEEEPFVLQDGDMLYVKTSGYKSFFINSSNIISSAASAGIYAATK
jgi:polysaccharide export outer membrane protein